MTAFVSHTTIDCRNAYQLSQWWKRVLGYADVDGDPNEPGHEECLIRDPGTGHRLLFIEVPDDKVVKNRVHLDLVAREGSRDAEVRVLVDLGAVVLEDHRGKHGPGTGWVTFADPEGNEFCLVRSEAERAGTPPVV